MRLAYYFLPCLAVLALSGCGPSVGSVSGTVTYKGKPLASGKVTFVASDQKVKTSPIGTDGSYSIDKVTVGPAKIAVDPPIPPAPMMPPGMKMDPSKMDAPAASAPPPPPKSQEPSFPQQYQDPEKSGLTHTVISGKQQHNIELK